MLTTTPCDENSNKNILMVLVDQCEKKACILFFDGSKCLQGAKVKIMLVALEGGIIHMAYKLNFECTKNMVKYEVIEIKYKNQPCNQLVESL